MIQNSISSDDLISLNDGEANEERLINVYFKILEKINFFLLKASDYIKSQSNNSASAAQSLAPQVALLKKVSKVLYCNTNFIRDLRLCSPENYEQLRLETPKTNAQRAKYEKILNDINDHDLVLIPFYPEQSNADESEAGQHTPMLVELKPKIHQATLYMRAGDRITTTTQGSGNDETPNPTETTGKCAISNSNRLCHFCLFYLADLLSEEVMKIFTNRALYFGEQFDIDMVDGGTSEVCVRCDEDYMVAMAYVAECHTFQREVNLEKFEIVKERNKMVDLYMRMLKF